MNQPQHETLFGPLTQDDRLAAGDAARVVRVALESGVDRLFDYAAPDEMVGHLAPGQRVRVPVGRGNRLQTGFVVEIPKTAQVAKLKLVASLLDSEPLLDEAMLRLARWIGQYYCAALGHVLTAMVPAAVKGQAGLRRRAWVQLTPAGRDPDNYPERLSRAGRAILERLIEAGDRPWPVDELAEEIGCTRAPLNTLARGSLVEISYRQEFDTEDLTAEAALAAAEKTPEVILNEDQQAVLAQARGLLDEGGFRAMLLHGVTGSGKTEIYIRCLEEVVRRGGQGLVLVPEIALTPQTLARFMARFERVAILHSGLTPSQRHLQWRRAARGEADVVVGARSAVFAPLERLGLIVVDEEHEPSYKQDQTPRYHGRDVALKRAADAGIPIILGSATPSLESLHNCETRGHYYLLRLERRVLNLPLPPVQIVDLREELRQGRWNRLLSKALEEQLERTLREKRQAILLLNRRGHASYIFCPSCNYVLTCPNCDVSMTCHKTQRQFDVQERTWVMCHYCTHSTTLPKLCPVCAKKLRLLSPGTQQAWKELTARFPEANFCRVDSDAVKPNEYPDLLARFGRGEIDVLVGTQMIGKGLDYPNVALVGVLNADTALSIPDFRSSERTFQLISQVAGRCGRATADSRVVVQTFLPDDPAVELACKHDYETFARLELEGRRRGQLPPFHRWARIVLRDQKLEKTEQAAGQLRRELDRLVQAEGLEVKLIGPTPAALARLEGYHRFQVLMHAERAETVQRLLGRFRAELWPGMAVRSVVDVDPINLM